MHRSVRSLEATLGDATRTQHGRGVRQPQRGIEDLVRVAGEGLRLGLRLRLRLGLGLRLRVCSVCLSCA